MGIQKFPRSFSLHPPLLAAYTKKTAIGTSCEQKRIQHRLVPGTDHRLGHSNTRHTAVIMGSAQSF